MVVVVGAAVAAVVEAADVSVVVAGEVEVDVRSIVLVVVEVDDSAWPEVPQAAIAMSSSSRRWIPLKRSVVIAVEITTSLKIGLASNRFGPPWLLGDAWLAAATRS